MLGLLMPADVSGSFILSHLPSGLETSKLSCRCSDTCAFHGAYIPNLTTTDHLGILTSFLCEA